MTMLVITTNILTKGIIFEKDTCQKYMGAYAVYLIGWYKK